jgi:hypothetical protein
MHYVNKEHVYMAYLEPGVRYQYKFIIDGNKSHLENLCLLFVYRGMEVQW